MLQGDDHLTRSWEAVLRYGLRGRSRGGQTGLFFLRPSDHLLEKRTLARALQQWDQVKEDLELDAEKQPVGVGDLECVKAVRHRPDGRRLVGVMRGTRVILVGMEAYS